MASLDTIILLIVDYHATIGGGGQDPRDSLCVCPCSMKKYSILAFWSVILHVIVYWYC